MTVKELLKQMTGEEVTLPEEALNAEAISCSCDPIYVNMSFLGVELPNLAGFIINILTDKHEISVKFEYNEVKEASIHDVKP